MKVTSKQEILSRLVMTKEEKEGISPSDKNKIELAKLEVMIDIREALNRLNDHFSYSKYNQIERLIEALRDMNHNIWNANK